MSQLECLDLDDNSIRTTFLSFFGPRLPETLVTLNIRANHITGDLEDSFRKALSLRYLTLCGNKLSGCLPDDFGGCTTLRDLRFSRLKLTGPLTPEISRFKDLRTLNGSSNGLSGGVAAVDWGSLTNLTELNLSSNPKLGYPLEASAEEEGGGRKGWEEGKGGPENMSQISWQGSTNGSTQESLLSTDRSTGTRGPRLSSQQDLGPGGKGAHETENHGEGASQGAAEEEGEEEEGETLTYSPSLSLEPLAALSVGLMKLDLMNCGFGGPVPPGICSIHSLARLNLASNRLTGPLPPLHSLTALRSIEIQV